MALALHLPGHGHEGHQLGRCSVPFNQPVSWGLDWSRVRLSDNKSHHWWSCLLVMLIASNHGREGSSSHHTQLREGWRTRVRGVKLWRLMRHTNSILLHQLPGLHVQVPIRTGHAVHGRGNGLCPQDIRGLHMMCKYRLSMATTLATCSTLLPSSHIRHALT